MGQQETEDFDILPVDLTDPAGMELLERLAARHGVAMAACARVAERLFLMRSRVAPGLRFVGAVTPAGQLGLFSLSGAGETVEDALAACLGEGVERLAQVERAGDVVRAASLADVAGYVLPSIASRARALLSDKAVGVQTAVAWLRGSDLASGAPTLVPADWCLRRTSEGALRVPGTALSAGAAAGPDLEAATLAGLLELIERDAAAMWWLGGRRGRALAADSAAMQSGVVTLARMRSGCTRRVSWLLDITTEFGVPCIAALSSDEHGRQLAVGLAARLDAGEAARKAVIEMCQMELGVLLVQRKVHQMGPAGLDDFERRLLLRNDAIDAETCDLLHPLGRPSVGSGPRDVTPGGSALAHIVARLGEDGVETTAVSLARDLSSLSVVCVTAPELQALPAGYTTRRLHSEIAKSGGGFIWTSGTALI
jgi:ribosomal protein S12 methylthiotransferase accessory factor